MQHEDRLRLNEEMKINFEMREKLNLEKAIYEGRDAGEAFGVGSELNGRGKRTIIIDARYFLEFIKRFAERVDTRGRCEELSGNCI